MQSWRYTQWETKHFSVGIKYKNLHILFLIAVVSFCLLCVIMQAPSLPIPCWCCSKNSLMNLLLKSMNDPVEIRNWTHKKNKTKPADNNSNTATQLYKHTAKHINLKRIVCLLWPNIHAFTFCEHLQSSDFNYSNTLHINWWMESIKIIYFL